MAIKTIPFLNNFNSGEVSPKLDLRIDIEKYASGCRTLENFVPLVEGGAMKMPGTYYVCPTKYSTKKSRMVPFQFSTIQAYQLEFGDKYIRFYKDNGQIIVTPSAWITGTDYVIGDIVTFTGSYYRCLILHTSGTFSTDLSALKWILTSGSTDLAYEIVTPYLEADLFDLDVKTQSADILYIFHSSYPPAKLERHGHDDWELVELACMDGITRKFYSSGEYPCCGTFFEQRLVLAGSINNPQDLDFSVSGDYENFHPDPAVEDAAINLQIVSDRVDRIRWLIGQEVLIIGTFGGIWKIGSTSYIEPLTATNVIARKQVSTGAGTVQPEMVGDSILWVSRSSRTVRIFIYSYESEKWIVPDMTRVAKHITMGETAALSGIVDVDYQSEPMPIFWSIRRDGQLLGMTYDIQEKVYAWFRIVTDGTIESVSIIGEENYEDQIWITVNRIIGGVDKRYIEYFKPYEFFGELKDAFYVHSGLTWDGGAEVTITDITQASPAVVTASSHGFSNGNKVRIHDVLGMTQVNQGYKNSYTVANKTTHTFELSGIDSTGWTAYTSSGLAQKVTNTIITGLDHLDGEVVDILVDGTVHPQKTVTSGSVTLDYYGNKIHVGLPYTAILEPNKLNVSAQGSMTRVMKQKITKVMCSFYQTTGAKIGPDIDNLIYIPFGTGGQPVLFTGDIDYEFPGDWDTKATLSIVSDQPLPMTVLSIAPRYHVGED